ncbi:hypothetical protein BN1723_001058, partial [Verticillium longisporum]
MGHNTDQEEDAITVRAVAALVSLMPSTRTMEDFVSESDSDYTSYWRDWFISSRGNEYFCEIDEDYLTDRFNLTGLNTEVQYYQYALDLVTDVFDLDCDDDMRETIEKSARHLYGLVHARYIVTTRGLQKMNQKKDDMRRRLRKMDVEVGFRDDNMDDLEEESGDARVTVVQDATGQNAMA